MAKKEPRFPQDRPARDRAENPPDSLLEGLAPDAGQRVPAGDPELQDVDVDLSIRDGATGGDPASAIDNPPEIEQANVEDLQQALQDAQLRADNNWEKLLRVQAEFDNLRKRGARDLEQAHKYALERFAAELLPVKDSLELGLNAAGGEAGSDKVREGLELTLKMFGQVLEKFSIREVDPAAGDVFNPELHQAMTTRESAELPPNTVVSVMQKGYVLNGRLLRPALVIVARAPE